MSDFPANFEPNPKKLAVTVRLPMVSLKLRRWTGPSLEHGFGNKPLVELDGTGMFAELAIQRMVEAAGWSARWVCTYGAGGEGPRYLRSWSDAWLDDQWSVPLDAERDVLLARIAKENRGKYSGCWDVLAWKDERTLFIEAKHDKMDHIQATQLEWYWAALRAGLKEDDFVVAQWDFGEGQDPEVQ